MGENKTVETHLTEILLSSCSTRKEQKEVNQREEGEYSGDAIFLTLYSPLFSPIPAPMAWVNGSRTEAS